MVVDAFLQRERRQLVVSAARVCVMVVSAWCLRVDVSESVLSLNVAKLWDARSHCHGVCR